MAKIIIIGAGLTGLSTAYHLEQKGICDYLIFEQEPQPGGLCRSVVQDGFTFDYTGHLIHISDPYFKQFIQKIFSPHEVATIARHALVYSHHTYTRYPYQVNLYGLPPSVIAECIEGFVRRPRSRSAAKNYPQWVTKHFGSGLAKHFFFPFQHKLFDHPLTDITPSWTGRFVPQTSLEQMIRGALKPSDDKIGYNAAFLYPRRGGIEQLITSLKNKLTQPIHTHHTMTNLDVNKKVVTFANGHTQQYDYLINTSPLKTMLEHTHDAPTSSLRCAAANLLCTKVINFNLGLSRSAVTPAHWIYFPESNYPFYRLGFPSNLTDTHAPAGCSSISGECSYVESQHPAHYAAQMVNAGIQKTCDLFALEKKEIITQTVLSLTHAYVLYTRWREKHIAQLLATLATHDIYSIGRYGGWKYASMQEAVLDGKEIVERLVVMPAYKDVSITLPQVPFTSPEKEL